MAITRIGQATTNGGTGTSTAITTALPAGIASGDLMVLEVATGVGPYDLSDPAGWTQLRRVGDTGSAPAEAALEVWWKVAAASNTAPTLTAATATRWHTCIRVFRGVDGTSPFLAEDGAAESGGSTTRVHTAPALSNTDPGAWGLYALASRQIATPYTAAAGAGLVERVDQDTGNAGTTNLLYFAADSDGTVATGSVTYAATGSGGSAIAVAWAALLKPAGGGATSIAGVTAAVSVLAPDGTVSSGVAVAVTGVTAVVVVQGGNVPVAQVEVVDPSYPPDPYRESMRSGGYSLIYSVSAALGGVPIEGAEDLRPTGGSITDTSRPGVRRVLNLELAPEPGLFDKLSPIGTTLTVTARVTYLNRSVQTIPMGVFDVDSEKSADGRGGISIVAPDGWVRIQRARFVGPDQSTPGVSVQTQISALIAYSGSADPLMVDLTTRHATMGALVWEKDRDKAIIDLAKTIGAWVYYDRNGVPTLADIPTVGASADWLIDSGSNGVLVELDRERSRTETRNVVVVESSAAEGALFATQYVWDDDPASPTYAGVDPVNQPWTAGPFGIVTYYYDTPILSTVSAARAAGKSILARVSGLASQVSLGSAPNPAMDAFDVLDVLPLRERYDLPRVLERHVADVVTHSLAFGAQRIEGRSTRTEEIGGGS